MFSAPVRCGFYGRPSCFRDHATDHSITTSITGVSLGLVLLYTVWKNIYFGF